MGDVIPWPKAAEPGSGLDGRLGDRDDRKADKGSRSYDPRRVLDQLGEVRGPEPAGHSERWVIAVCPFDRNHNQGEAYVLRRPSGALVAGCRHDSCTWTWADLRAKFDPKPRRKVAKTSGVSGASEGSGGSVGRVPVLSDDVREDGAALLDEVRVWLSRFVVVMRPGDLDVLTLWAAHTWAGKRLYTSPRLQIDSPVPESGKTTVLEHFERLCYRAVIAVSISSEALLARLVAAEPRTLLLDEIDRTLDEKKSPTAAPLIAIINSGYKVGATRPVLVPDGEGGWRDEQMPTFGFVVMAGNQPNLPDDTRTRTIRVLLLPDWQGRAEESDWELIEDEALMLGARLGRWVRGADLSYRPDLPPGVVSRFREKWLPLARIAHAAGGRWLDAVRDLAAADVEEVRHDKEEGLANMKPAVLLLRHISECWPDSKTFWRTTEMVAALASEHPESWGPTDAYPKGLTVQRLGRLLAKSFRIRSSVEDRADKNSARGYWRRQFGPVIAALSRDFDDTETPVHPTSGTAGTSGAAGTAGAGEAVDGWPTEPPEPSEAPEPPGLPLWDDEGG